MSAAWARASPAMTGPCTSGDRADGREVARRGDGEAGLDDVDAEPRELVRDLQLLGLVQRDAGGLLTVAQRGVEDDDPVRVHGRAPLSFRFLLLGDEFAARAAAGALVPPEGEEKEAKESQARHG